MTPEIWLVDFSKVNSDELELFFRSAGYSNLKVGCTKDFRLQQMASEISLRFALSQVFSVQMDFWRFTKSQWGKPSIANSGYEDLKFNISHSGTDIAILVTPLDDKQVINVGVDIENLSRCQQASRIKEEFLSFDELQFLKMRKTNDVDRIALKYWTLKEAFSKAVGFGIDLPFQSIHLEIEHCNLIEVHSFRGQTFNPSEFFLTTLEPKPELQLSYCIQSKIQVPTNNKTHLLSIEDILAYAGIKPSFKIA